MNILGKDFEREFVRNSVATT